MTVENVDPSILDWLLEPDNPSVRYLALTELLGRPESDSEVREARAAIMQRGVVPALLDRQEEGGHWGRLASFYTAKYRGTVWQLLVLAEHRADGSDERVRRACEVVLGQSQDPEGGGFSHRASQRGDGGLPSGVIPCLTGNMVWALWRLGCGDDDRVRRGVDWLVRHLRFDDGDGAPPDERPYKGWEICYGRHSCLMGVVKGLKALAEVPPDRRSANVTRTIDAATELLLVHHVYKRSSDPSKVAKPGWTRFGFPRMYQTDALEMVSLLLRLGCRDPRMQEAVDLIRSRRRPDGRWLLQDTFNGKFVVDVEAKGEPSKWITFQALSALRRWDVGAAGR